MTAFRLPTQVLLAPGCVEKLPDLLKVEGESLPGDASRAFLVCDAGLARTATFSRVENLCRTSGIGLEVFDGVESNPRAGTVEEIARCLRDRPAAVIGLGGGSVLDAAKAAAMLATNEGDCIDFEGKERYQHEPLPFIAVPTTCGTGSEVTWVSVISVEEKRTKISIKGNSMFPDWALVDADLLTSLPSRLVAWTGLDALTHALEAVTGTQSNPASEALATRAVELLLSFLRRAVEDIEGDSQARTAVMEASTLAGMAFGNADVAAVHCLSETLGGLYDVPHGLANALLLVPILRSHGEAVTESLGAMGSRLTLNTKSSGAPECACDLLDRVEALVVDLELPEFSEFGIPEEDFPEIAERSTRNGSNGSNPRPMGKREYLEILESL